MIGPLARYLAQSTPAARRLLALLVAVFIPLLLVFAVALPLVESRARTDRALAEAEALHLWVHAQAAALPPAAFSAAAPPPAEAAGPIGISALEASLVAAGLRDRVSRLANQQGGAVEIGFDAAPFRALTDWLDANAATWGYSFTRLDIERAETPGHVTALLELAPRP